MNDMINRVARAIQGAGAARAEKLGWPTVTWEQIDPLNQRAYEDTARAAIEAMRQPTGRMVLAGRRKPPLLDWPEEGMRIGSSNCDVNPLNLDPNNPNNTAARRYQAMIDAALARPDS